MNKIVSFLILYFSLFIVEILIAFTTLVTIDFFQYGADFFYIKKALFGVGLMSFWRILFYGIPFIILYFLLFKYVENIKVYKPLLFSLFNSLVYISLSILSRVIWGKNVPLPPEGVMFWITCISIFLSPLILGQISYFKRVMR